MLCCGCWFVARRGRGASAEATTGGQEYHVVSNGHRKSQVFLCDSVTCLFHSLDLKHKRGPPPNTQSTTQETTRCQPSPTLSEAASRSRTSLLPTMHLHHPPPLIYTTTTMIPLSAPLMCTYHLHSPRRYTSFNSQSNHRPSTVSINPTTCLMRLNSDLTTACSN